MRRSFALGVAVAAGIAAAHLEGPYEEQAQVNAVNTGEVSVDFTDEQRAHVEPTSSLLATAAGLSIAKASEQDNPGIGYKPRKPYYGPAVSDREFQNITIFEQANKEQAQLNASAVDEDGCAQLGPFARQFQPLYAYAHGDYRRIDSSYTPGDAHLHVSAAWDGFPEGVSVKDGVFGFFNGQRFHLPGRRVNMADGDIAFEIPEVVGHPDSLDTPCD